MCVVTQGSVNFLGQILIELERVGKILSITVTLFPSSRWVLTSIFKWIKASDSNVDLCLCAYDIVNEEHVVVPSRFKKKTVTDFEIMFFFYI